MRRFYPELVVLALLVGCASGPKSVEDTVKEVQETADKAEKALDVVQEKTQPFIDAIDAACSVTAPDSEPCKVAGEAIERFGLALDKAQDAIDQYRAFTGDFGAVTRSAAEVFKAAADVAKAFVK